MGLCSALLVRWMTIAILFGSSRSFVCQFTNTPRIRVREHCLRAASDDNNHKNSAQKKQERILEELSLKGADKIRNLSIPERTKRAMLAEAIEDQIFEITERLEGLFDETNQLPANNRERAVELARTSKTLQTQYDELVSGRSSSVLNALEGVMGNTDSGDADN